MLFLAIFGKNVETAMTLWFGTTADGQVPTLGASGAIAAVLGAYFLGLWFLYQLVEADFGLFSASANGAASPSSLTSAGSSSAPWPRESSPEPGQSRPVQDKEIRNGKG
jgi:hypothetical protein